MERGIPRSIQRQQTPGVDDDEALRSAITEQCIRQEPTASAACYSQKDWELNFEQRWILQDERYMRTSTEIAGSGGAIYCRTCVEPRKHGKLAAFRMHVTIGDDPMKVAKHGIIMLECHNCGFEQVVHRKPKVRSVNGFDANGVYIDEASKISPQQLTALEQQIRHREAQMRMGKSLVAQGIYDPRMAAGALGSGVNLHKEIEQLRNAYQNQMIPREEFEAAVRNLMEDAQRRVHMAANPPMYGPIKPAKGPFDPP